MSTTANFSKKYLIRNREVTLSCVVTLKDDGKLSITKKRGGWIPSDYYRLENTVKELITTGFTDLGFTNVISDKDMNSEAKKLLNELKKQTEPLRIAYIKHSKEFASKQFYKMEKITEQDVINEKGYDSEWGGKVIKRHTKASLAYWNNIKGILNKGHENYVGSREKFAKLHYEDSMVKLTNRIIKKGLDFSKITIVTDLTRFDKGNIETTIKDGQRIVRAFTILAWGEVNAPHYRYLIK